MMKFNYTNYIISQFRLEGGIKIMLLALRKRVIAIGASTGGVEAIEALISRFPASIPPVVLVIHMPIGFTKLLAERLDGLYNVAVKEAKTGDLLECGQVLIAEAGKHMITLNKDGALVVECYVGSKVQHSMPSVDVLFESVAKVLHKNAIGIILTGMGADGARGLLAMRKAGASTIGQNRDTCVIYGMPKIAKEMGAVEYELPLNEICDKVLSLL